jgi:DNA-directed RNA polymerase subunit RPC12/RpoP
MNDGVDTGDALGPALGNSTVMCLECGREIDPAGRTLAQLPGGLVCQDCDRKRRELERRARRSWIEVLWEDNPSWHWVVVLIIVLVLLALMRFVEL